ncbi:15303_t:CDS:2 [Funneliformis mosseae]|uniref:15303_t:CDS:1 n=1 Tax=Funneliformis mosseae TaxID=27381 RepID=A0A9N9GZV4_FUNMO|nr:15303_t:CDS:2 [Funneliformis mosseae]
MSILSKYIINLEEFDELLEYDSFVTDTEEINQDDEESEIAKFIRDNLIKDIKYSLVPIKYLTTSDEGIA